MNNDYTKVMKSLKLISKMFEKQNKQYTGKTQKDE